MNFSLFKAYEIVLKFFKNDIVKADFWFKCKNPNFGGLSPNEMISIGREDKLIKFIINSTEGNYP